MAAATPVIDTVQITIPPTFDLQYEPNLAPRAALKPRPPHPRKIYTLTAYPTDPNASLILTDSCGHYRSHVTLDEEIEAENLRRAVLDGLVFQIQITELCSRVGTGVIVRPEDQREASP